LGTCPGAGPHHPSISHTSANVRSSVQEQRRRPPAPAAPPHPDPSPAPCIPFHTCTSGAAVGAGACARKGGWGVLSLLPRTDSATALVETHHAGRGGLRQARARMRAHHGALLRSSGHREGRGLRGLQLLPPSRSGPCVRPPLPIVAAPAMSTSDAPAPAAPAEATVPGSRKGTVKFTGTAAVNAVLAAIPGAQLAPHAPARSSHHTLPPFLHWRLGLGLPGRTRARARAPTSHGPTLLPAVFRLNLYGEASGAEGGGGLRGAGGKPPLSAVWRRLTCCLVPPFNHQ
jgi:hypothetical protein